MVFPPLHTISQKINGFKFPKHFQTSQSILELTVTSNRTANCQLQSETIIPQFAHDIQSVRSLPFAICHVPPQQCQIQTVRLPMWWYQSTTWKDHHAQPHALHTHAVDNQQRTPRCTRDGRALFREKTVFQPNVLHCQSTTDILSVGIGMLSVMTGARSSASTYNQYDWLTASTGGLRVSLSFSIVFPHQLHHPPHRRRRVPAALLDGKQRQAPTMGGLFTRFFRLLAMWNRDASLIVLWLGKFCKNWTILQNHKTGFTW